MTKYVYKFSKNLAEGDKDQKNLLGGKGANLHEMCKMDLPVPPGFTISTETCNYYYANKETWPKELETQINEALTWLQKETGKAFGDTANPLLVSVRSGARVSMPGMMDTVLNLGLNDETLEGIAKKTNRRFALDSYRRFIFMYSDVVLNLKAEKGEEDPFEEILDDVKKRAKKNLDNELNEDELSEVIKRAKAYVLEKSGKPFPNNPQEQLRGAINAVFASWMNERAIEYRRIYRYPAEWGTAVNIQSMAFGNMGDDCGTGVAFTRDPATGENVFYGEFLMNAQGEDVVAGTRTPLKIEELGKNKPKMLEELYKVRKILEDHYHDMQDIEFTIENDKLYMLQCRSGKRTGLAAIRIALDMLEEGHIDEKTAIMRLEAGQVTTLLRPIFDTNARKIAVSEGRLLAKGLPAGPGAANGRVVFFSDEVPEKARKWGRCILVRIETSPEDIKGMEAAEGILTARGGMTSHAALVARQRGKVCVAGCSDVSIDYKTKQMTVSGKVVKEGDVISIDGSTGEVFLGEIPTAPSEVMEVLVNKTKKPEDSKTFQRFSRLMEIADKFRTMEVRTNADAPGEAQIAIDFGARGIGLCRTEHMFFEGDRIVSMRKMILAENETDRRKALEELLPYQREDFTGIFKAMGGYPVTIRLLDPPLHEFLPHTPAEQEILAKRLNVTAAKVHARVEDLHESNPMLGHRGCRLGITYPEITEMQARAIFEAACDVKKAGVDVHPEVMVPLISHYNEFRNQEAVVRRVADTVFKEKGISVEYMVGTMIEIPRAAMTADEIGKYSEFFSFGTNDLTQTGFGMSRDDYAKFMPEYIEKGVLECDPFVSIDPGVGRLMKIAVEGGRASRPNIKLGICGEQGGDPESVMFCHQIGLNYVSCSPYRVPVARVAAAQAALAEEKK